MFSLPALRAPAAPFLFGAALILSGSSVLAQGDDCSTAAPIGGTGTFAFDNTSNSSSGFTGGTCTGSIRSDVFWRWTATQSGDYQFDTFGSSFDTNMSVHSGGDCNATCLGSNNDAGTSLQSEIQITGVLAGDELLIQVGSFHLFVGPGQMNITQINDPCAGLSEDNLEPNDTCATAQTLAPGTYSNLFASQTDPDFYGIAVQPGERLQAQVTSSNPGDVDLSLYDPSCGLIATDGASLGYTNVGPNTRIFVLEAFLDTTSTVIPCAQYDLNVQVTADPCVGMADDMYEDNDTCYTATPMGNGTLAGLHVNRWDKDFIELCVPAQSTVTIDTLFTHAQGDVDIYLMPDWAFPCGIGNAGYLYAMGTSVDDNESITWTNGGNNNQRCYLEINIWHGSDSSCNDYDLVVGGVDLCSMGSNFCGPAPDNSAGQPGEISARGSLQASANNVTLVASDLPHDRFGYFLVSRGQGVLQNPAGSWGHLCLAGAHPIGRLNEISSIGFSQGGRFEIPIDLTNLPEPPGYSPVQAGETWNFQAWHRDIVAGQSGSNLTNGLEITFQ
ncbi:MAG: hypothetical protein GY930_05830 [bacterium]|nr:hypothetical protein [bacterium]